LSLSPRGKKKRKTALPLSEREKLNAASPGCRKKGRERQEKTGASEKKEGAGTKLLRKEKRR